VTGVLHIGVETVDPARAENVTEPDGFYAESPQDGLLGQMRERALGRHRSRDSQVLGVVSQQHRQQRGLARSVAPDEAHLLAVADDKRDWFEQAPRTNLYAQLFDDEH
jgi:hypothetical protein